MNTNHNIEDLSNRIWKNYFHRPTRIETEPFDNELAQINIQDFIVFNFLNHQGTSLRELLLSTFKFWKDFSLENWKHIFDRLRKNNLAEYYMAIIASQYLGIDPRFRSARNVQIVHFTAADGKRQSGKPSLFVDNMQGELRKMEEEELKENFGLTIDDFIAIKNKLDNEIQAERNPKNFWDSFWGK